MKKIILLVCLLVFGSVAYGKPAISERMNPGVRYLMNSGTILYYQFDMWSKGGGTLKCSAKDNSYQIKDAAFEVINDGMFWFGSPAGIYKLNASNNYQVALTFNNIIAADNEWGGNVIFISKSKPTMTFNMECGYKK